jgi:hypothetical protein
MSALISIGCWLLFTPLILAIPIGIAFAVRIMLDNLWAAVLRRRPVRFGEVKPYSLKED